MSSFDIGKIVSSLLSTKIKERNDALNSLETVTLSKFRLNLKQFRLLSLAVLKLIEHESRIYMNNKSTTVDSRLSQASYYLRLLTEKSIEDTRVNLKHKTYLDLVLGIKDQYYIGDDEILPPCSIDFIKTISSILNLEYVKEHLNTKDWCLIFNFLVKLINTILDNSDASITISGSNEKLLTDLYTALQNLLQCENNMSVNYMHMYDNDNYFKLLRIIDRTSELIKKESVIVIIVFRIINKMIITTCTENFKFVNKLIKIGIRLMVLFYNTHLDKLQDQFLVFINLQGTHDFMNLHLLPKLIGDQDILGDNDVIDEDESIKSQLDEDQDEVFLYNIGVLIQHMFGKVMTGAFELKPEDIGITAIDVSEQHWFKLRSMYLSTQNYKSWLLILGTVRLMKSYYDLKQITQKQSNDPQASFLLFSTGSSGKNKRQKLGTIADSISNSNSALEFCNKLIHAKDSPDTQLLGLKLLIFYLELFSSVAPNKEHKEQPEEVIEDSVDTTMGDNTTFDFMVASLDDISFDKNVVLKNILATFDDNSMNFWSLLSARSIITDSISQIGSSRIKSSHASQLLKLSLLLLKENEVSSIACNVIYKLVFERDEQLSKLIDDSVLIQLETLIDLSEINGPSKIAEESFQFWFAMHKLAVEVNLSKKSLLARRIQDWIMAKWDSTFRPDIEFVHLGSSFAEFIHWISGNSIVYTPSRIGDFQCDTDLIEPYYFSKNYQYLESFLCLKDNQEIRTEAPIEVNSIIANEKMDLIIRKINATFKVFDNNQVSSASLLKWVVLLLHLVVQVKPLMYFAHEVNALEYQISAGLDSFNDSTLDYDEIITTMQICNQFLPNDKEIRRLFIRRFSLDKLINTLKFDYLETTTRNIAKRPYAEDGFGREFADVRESSTPPSGSTTVGVTYTKIQYKLAPSVDALKFIQLNSEIQGKNASDMLTSMVSYVELLTPEKFLPAVLFIIEEVLVNHESIGFEDIPLLKLLRIINDKLLTTQIYDRNEITLIVVAKFLSVLAPVWMYSSDSSMSTDFYDLATWLYESGIKDYITREIPIVEFCKFLMQLLIHREERTFSASDVRAELFRKFSRSTNSMKNNLSSMFVQLAHSMSTADQGHLYKNIFEGFTSPSQSVEKGGTFAKFLTTLSEGSSHILRLALFNLLECSKFPFFISYLEKCLQDLCKIMNLPSSRNLFKAFQYEIIRTWKKFGSIESFPYMLFLYSDLNSFYRDNYRALVAITLSTKTDDIESNHNFINQLAVLRRSDVSTLVSESISLIIPLSFTADGVRNSIFEVLGTYLEDSMKSEMTDKLSLIILELIKFIDMSNESTLLGNFKDNEVAMALIDTANTKNVAHFGNIVISFDSASQLLNRLVQKFARENDYWSPKQIYFLIRRISISLKSVTTLDQKLLHLRRLKLVLVLGGTKSIDIEVTQLLVTLLCPLMIEVELVPDIMLILLLFKDLYHHVYPHERSLLLIIHIINSLLSSKLRNRNDWLLDCLDEFINMCNRDRAITQIVQSGIDILKGKRVSISSSVVELCLEDNVSDDIFPVCLISQIFEHVETMDHLGGKLPVIERLLSLDEDQLHEFSEKFKLWIANYLSDFYVKGGTREDIKALTIKEYNDIPVDDFEDEVKYFDYTLGKIISYIKSDNYEAAACAESILGVLIRKYNENRRDVSKVLNFETTYESYSHNILPVDFHACIILNDKADISFLGDRLSVIIEDFENLLRDDTDLWCTKLYLSILQELATYTNIAPLLSIFIITVPEFAKFSLPTMVCNYLVMKGKTAENMIITLLDEYLTIPKKSESSVKIFLQIVILIRVGAKYANKQVFTNVFENINKLEFYRLASDLKLFKTAIMLFEDAVSDDHYEKVLEDHYRTLQTVYQSIDDDDLIFGLPEKTTMDYAISMINRVGNPTERLRFSSARLDTSMMLNLQPSYAGVIGSMTNAGLLGVSRALSKSANIDVNEDEQYEWSWKLSKWDLPVAKNAQKENEVIYKTLKQLHDYPLNTDEICKTSLLNIIDQKNSINNSSVKEFKLERLSWLKTISTVVSISEIAKLTSQEFPMIISQFSKDTQWFKEVEFDMFENLLLARQATFQLLSESSKPGLSHESIWLGALGDLVRYNNLARVNNEEQKMVTSTMLIEEIGKRFTESQAALIKNISNLSCFQTAQTLWTQGNTSVPVLLLKDLYKFGGVSIPAQNLNVDKCLIRAMMVNWMSQSRQEIASSIMEKYVLPTAELSLELSDLQQQSETFEILARFCEEQYKSKPTIEQISKLQKRVFLSTNEMKEMQRQYKDGIPAEDKQQVRKYFHKLKAQNISETKDLESMKSSHELMAVKAVEFYLKSISMGDFHEENLDKFFALWLEQSENESLHRSLQKELLALPSYKLISWCPQLVSRLTTEKTEFQNTLRKLIFNLCIDHPHHSLYLLIALRLQNSSTVEQTELIRSKCLAAETLWETLLIQDKEYVHRTLIPINDFVSKSIQLASTKANRAKTVDLSRFSCGDYWLNNLPHIPPPTKTIQVDPTKRYDRVPVLLRAEGKISIATSGISMPKIVTFMLSNGSEHKILFKLGSDDLRQDSIMEQVFNKVNNIFAKDRECNKRTLKIRTYNVVPLGPNSGIIEFVPHSKALMDAVHPYHTKLDSMPIKTAREIMRNYQSSDTKQRAFEYEKIEKQIKPVLRLFFQRNFLTADSWFESRMKYTHGTATNSIVGHMLGLGDRHCNNILLDTRTGEPIHIDLGVAFDQGKRLPVPETVPFRLSRDVVDGFGVTGVEGVFKKSCEHTFRVLRSNKEHIISILDVLKWDLLFEWTLSPVKKRKLQNDEGGAVGNGDTNNIASSESESEASRAIRTVVEKLIANELSTEAAVRELIQEATSSLNLALIYQGWSPFY